jgi:glycosyltransferase involved in cell wall biosynthesis
MPAVSFIIPTYNAAVWLPECLDSVLAQTVRDFEVVVVDDGSTDDTSEVLARYRDHIRVIQGGHGGLSAARNLGLQHACADLIAFHDADDVVTPDRLEFSLDFLRSHPEFDGLFCNGQRMPTGAEPPTRVVPDTFSRRLRARAVGAIELFDGFPVFFQTAILPRAAFLAAGPFDAAYRVQPDIEYAYRLIRHCRAGFVDRVVFHYRWHTTNITRDRLRCREELAALLEALPRTAPEALRAIGARRVRIRLARHWFRIGRLRLERDQPEGARDAWRRAAALCPLHPRYQWTRLRHLG